MIDACGCVQETAAFVSLPAAPAFHFLHALGGSFGKILHT